jgi:hypothetical protein
LKTIVAKPPPQRSTLYHKALEDGRLADESTRALLLRMKLISNGVIVKPPIVKPPPSEGGDKGAAQSAAAAAVAASTGQALEA